MSGDYWSYRFGIIDHLARSGEMQFGDGRYQLPLLLDPLDQDGNYSILTSGGDWSGVSIRLGSLEEREEIPDVLREAQQESLRDIGADPLIPVVSTSKAALFGDAGSGMSELPVHVLSYFGLLSREPRKAARALMELTASDPLHEPLFLPGVTNSGNLEILFYLGIEIFDTVGARKDAMRGLYYTDLGPVPLDRISRFGEVFDSCGCEGCGSLGSSERNREAAQSILVHNVEHTRRRLSTAFMALREGRLRELVMGRVSGNPEWFSALRDVEGSGDGRLYRMSPSYRNLEKVTVTYRDDINAPDFTSFRRSVIERYIPLEGRSVLLLLPCSARKPYSTSRTHQRIRDALKVIRGWRASVQQVVVTSPLGAVPMELEDLYPASHYDIPVTGRWFPEELDISRELVSSIFKKGRYNDVICFHGEGSTFFPPEVAERIFPGAEFVDIHSGAQDSGQDPYRLLGRALGDLLTSVSSGGWEKEELLALVRFSLGMDISKLEDLNVKWSRRGRELRSGKEPLVVFRKGGPVPTQSGGRTIWDRDSKDIERRVIIDDFSPKGTIFSQGIEEVVGLIRPGDVVLVGTDGEYRGVGRALVPGVMMKGDVYGPAVKMIHGSG
ncbi:MAG: DUF5591 domain-containing protein [Thermoplasmatota archaeon]